MVQYLSDRKTPLHLASNNLLTMRADLHYELFDKAEFVTGQRWRIAGSFLADCQHRWTMVSFIDNNAVLRACLLARFGYFKIARTSVIDENDFQIKGDGSRVDDGRQIDA
jgi:hypothetical protein